MKQQPKPVTTNDVCIQDLVLSDLLHRKEIGTAKYGTPLRPFNGRDALQDLYEELLDAVQYIRQEMFERENHYHQGKEFKKKEIIALLTLEKASYERIWQESHGREDWATQSATVIAMMINRITEC